MRYATKIIDMIKFILYAEEPYKPLHDLVDNQLVRLSETSREGDRVKLRLECLVDYHSEVHQYMILTKASVKEEGNIRFVYVAGLVPKNLDIFKETTPKIMGVGETVVFEYDASLGSEEMNNPSKLAPRVVDIVLHHKEGLKVEDYTIDSACCKDVPSYIDLSAENKEGCRLLVIDLKAKLATNQTR